MIFVIVDACATGTKLARLLKEKGHRCLSVQSMPELPAYFQSSYDASLFEHAIPYREDLNALVGELKAYAPKFVVPGMETGVELADVLGERLGLSSNGTKLSAARRDKYLMVEALRAKGLATVSHFRSSSVDEILLWIAANASYPVVLKPARSACGETVTICDRESEVGPAFDKIFGRINQLGSRNDDVIVQSFLDGTEYIVNTVSHEGLGYVCDIWKCRKERIEGAGFISCLEELLPSEGKIEQQLARYASEVLDALEIKYGPVHLEIMFTANGPVLIEAGARLQGAIHPPSISEATGTNQVELTVEAYTNPTGFRERAKTAYQMKNKMYHLFMVSRSEGVLKSLDRLKEIEGLPSFFNHVTKLKVGDQLQKTVDLITSVGIIDLIHHDPLTVEQDYVTLRDIEANGLYHV